MYRTASPVHPLGRFERLAAGMAAPEGMTQPDSGLRRAFAPKSLRGEGHQATLADIWRGKQPSLQHCSVQLQRRCQRESKGTVGPWSDCPFRCQCFNFKLGSSLPLVTGSTRVVPLPEWQWHSLEPDESLPLALWQCSHNNLLFVKVALKSSLSTPRSSLARSFQVL